MLLTRSPLGVTRCCHRVVLARLACVRHAASVHPEPGSNSPSEIVNVHGPEGSWGCSRRSSVALEPPSLTIRPGRTGGMGGAGALPCTARGSSVIRMRQGTVPRGRAPEGRGFGTGFSHTVEFSRNVAGLLFGDSPAVPASCHRQSGGTVPRAFQIVKDFPPARSAYSWWSTTCHVDTFTQKRRPAPGPAGRQDGHRTAVGSNPLGARRPPVFRCRRRGRRPGEVLGLEELPCLQLGDGSTGLDSVSTRHRCRMPTTPTDPAGRVFPRRLRAGAGPGTPAGAAGSGGRR